MARATDACRDCKEFPSQSNTTVQVAAVAVREYGTVVPLGLDGSFMVYERLDYDEAKRRAPDQAASLKRMREIRGSLGASATSGGGSLEGQDFNKVGSEKNRSQRQELLRE